VQYYIPHPSSSYVLTLSSSSLLFSFTPTPPTSLYTLSLHDGSSDLPFIHLHRDHYLFAHFQKLSHETVLDRSKAGESVQRHNARSEEHTSELQSRFDLVCRLLLEKKKKLSI